MIVLQENKIVWSQLWRIMHIYDIQDGGQLNISNQNLSLNKADITTL